MVDDDGKLVYVQDAYTTSDRFPDAQSFDPATLTSTAFATGSINYIRNSVKITMDAYDGTMHFYVSDPSDPIIRAYSGIFPSMFEPLSIAAGRADRSPARARGAVQHPDHGCSVATT